MELLDPSEILNAIATLHQPPDCFEVRVLEGKDKVGGYATTWGGWFDNPQAVVDALLPLRGGWHGVYVTLNPTDPLLLHRTGNRLQRQQRGATTGDTQIARRRWLPLDFDPLVWGEGGKVAGIATTDAEKALAFDRAALVAAALSDAGFPAAIMGDSGNGAHLLYRCDLPRESGLVERFLRAVSHLYGDDPGSAPNWNRAATVAIDTAVFNPARIWKLYGTLNCKGSGIGDRPWRMARLTEVPPDEPIVTVPQLEAWLASVAHLLPGAEPVKVKPAVAAPSAPQTAGGEFDPVAYLQANSAAVLGPGKTRDDGATFYELHNCLCERQTERKMVLSVSKSGAAGLSCRHGTCPYSDTKAKPGDHWKEWRKGVAGPSEPRKTTAERTADAARFGQSMRDDTATMDAAAFLGGPVELAPEPPPPRPAARQSRSDSRVRVSTNQDNRDIRDEVLFALAKSPEVFVSQRMLAKLDGTSMQPLDGGDLDSEVVDQCAMVKPVRDRSTGQYFDQPDTLPVRVRGMLEKRFTEAEIKRIGLRQVDQVSSSPFFTIDGTCIDQAGYSEKSRTLLVDPPKLIDHPEPDAAACLDWLRNLFSDFVFKDGIHSSNFSNFIGCLLAPMVRPMIRGPMPMLVIEGNTPGLGKSMLGNAIRTIYGLKPAQGAMPADEQRMAALIVGVLMNAEPVHLFDDVMHKVQSAALNRVITGDNYEDRVLGFQKVVKFVVRQLFIATMNDAKIDNNMIRRVVMVMLRWDRVGKPEDREDVKIRSFPSYIEDHRVEILSRMRQMVQSWVDAGMPEPRGLPVMGSFDRFAAVIGSILHHAGDRQWLQNMKEAKASVIIDDDWQEFLDAWHNDYSLSIRSVIRPGELWQFAQKNSLLPSIMTSGNESAQIARVQQALKAKCNKPEVFGYKITEGMHAETGLRGFRLTIAQQTALEVH